MSETKRPDVGSVLWNLIDARTRHCKAVDAAREHAAAEREQLGRLARLVPEPGDRKVVKVSHGYRDYVAVVEHRPGFPVPCVDLLEPVFSCAVEWPDEVEDDDQVGVPTQTVPVEAVVGVALVGAQS
jgi:hypothetical protein